VPVKKTLPQSAPAGRLKKNPVMPMASLPPQPLQVMAPVAVKTENKLALGVLMICCVALLGTFGASIMAGLSSSLNKTALAVPTISNVVLADFNNCQSSSCAWPLMASSTVAWTVTWDISNSKNYPSGLKYKVGTYDGSNWVDYDIYLAGTKKADFVPETAGGPYYFRVALVYAGDDKTTADKEVVGQDYKVNGVSVAATSSKMFEIKIVDFHPADKDKKDFIITHDELNAYASSTPTPTATQIGRAVTFYNAGGYIRQLGTSDGFAPILTSTTLYPAAAAFIPRDNCSPQCIDTDNGVDYFTAGSITTNDTQSSGHIFDRCLVQLLGNRYMQVVPNGNCGPEDGNCYIEEVYCNCGVYHGYTYSYAFCPNGCNNGACVE